MIARSSGGTWHARPTVSRCRASSKLNGRRWGLAWWMAANACSIYRGPRSFPAGTLRAIRTRRRIAGRLRAPKSQERQTIRTLRRPPPIKLLFPPIFKVQSWLRGFKRRLRSNRPLPIDPAYLMTPKRWPRHGRARALQRVERQGFWGQKV